MYKDREGVDGSSVKVFSGPADRNTAPILDILTRIAPSTPGRVLCVAEGSGQHVTAFAKALPQLVFLPTEIEAAAMASIKAYADEAALPNIESPVILDVTSPQWDTIASVGDYSLVYAVNICHISPFAATRGLMDVSSKVLKSGGTLLLYGPFKVKGEFSSEGNKAFDERLRQRDPSWGYRDVAEVQEAAKNAGMELKETIEVPANNLVLLFCKL